MLLVQWLAWLKVQTHKVLWLGLVCLLAGCSEPTINDHYDEYLTRLARVLEQDLPDWRTDQSQSLQQRYPGRKDRQWSATDTRMGVFDFLALDDCDLINLVSERNSSLGKVMSSTSRYQYEWLIIQGVTQCINTFKENPEEAELVSKLNNILITKQQELSKHYWNATWGSDEFQAYFSLSKPVLDVHEVSGFKPPSVEALENYLSGLPALNSTSADFSKGVFEQSAQLEKHLQPLQYHYGGRLLKSLILAELAISQGTQLLQQALAEGPICYNGKPSKKAEILNTVLTKYYVIALQPYLSRLEKEATYLWRTVESPNRNDLPFQKDTVVTFMGSYFSAENGRNVLANMREATKDHAQQWSELLEHCGLRVGNRG